jgi:tRNA threonylcarbamoyladenosine biosynthesis protein TsaB
MITLALDTATPRSSCALLRDGELLGERETRAVAVLEAADALLAENGLEPGELGRVVCGTGPGSFTGIRIGLAAVRALALALDLSAAGVSTLAALQAASPGARAVIDGARGEVFTLVAGEPAVVRPEEMEPAPGTVCVGDGAVRYRRVLEEAGAEVPPDSSELHRVRANFLAELATGFGPAERIAPIYLRVPDAEKALERP